MQIVLTPDDLKRLKPETRQALFEQLGIETGPAKARGRAPASPKPSKADDPLAELVDSINDRSRAALTQLVKSGGESTWKAIAGKVSGIELGRFMASVHRRYRTLTRNQKAVLVTLRGDGDDARLHIAAPQLKQLKALLK